MSANSGITIGSRRRSNSATSLKLLLLVGLDGCALAAARYYARLSYVTAQGETGLSLEATIACAASQGPGRCPAPA
jgi:hypothetical protein